MDYFPAFLGLDARACLLVGGGSVAARKAKLLLAAGADLTVVSPQLGTFLSDRLAAGDIRYIARKFKKVDVRDKWLVVTATGDAQSDAKVFRAATEAKVFCNAVDDRDSSSYVTPAIVDRSPVVVAISTGGSAPVLARRLRANIESMLADNLGTVATIALKFRERVRDAIGDASTRLRFWERAFDGPLSAISENGGARQAEYDVAQMIDDFVAFGDAANEGHAWLVGAGPGDPGLLTLNALRVMQTADVILHDRLVSAEVLALARRDARLVSVGKMPGCRQNSQEEINAMLVDLVRKGDRVCRLKGGDPFIFGRGGEEAEALTAAGLNYSVVPGITAAAGCAAAAGIPLTHRDVAQSLVLVTAHGKDSVDKLDWASLARDRQTLAVYMAVRRFPELMNRLVRHGRSANTPIAIIERGTTPGQRVIRGHLGQLTLLAESHGVEAPAMLIIGDVAALGGDVGNREMRTPSDTILNKSRKSAIPVERLRAHP